MIGRVTWRISEVDSTQNIAFRLAELGAAHGTVVRADYQSSGRGRLDRSWDAPKNSALMFSVIIRPDCHLGDLGPISILVADALADVLQQFTESRIYIKWPNDVLIAGQKTSGILLQTRTGVDPVAVLGIGVNVSIPANSLPEGATSLHQHATRPVDIEELYVSLLVRLDSMWSSFQPELSPEQMNRLNSRLWLCGEMVTILDAHREMEGRIVGIAKSGGLRLSVNGQEREIVAGEIRRGPRQITT